LVVQVVGEDFGLLAGAQQLLQGVAQGQHGRIVTAAADGAAEVAEVRDLRQQGHLDVLEQVAGALLRVGEELPQGHAPRRGFDDRRGIPFEERRGEGTTTVFGARRPCGVPRAEGRRTGPRSGRRAATAAARRAKASRPRPASPSPGSRIGRCPSLPQPYIFTWGTRGVKWSPAVSEAT